QDPSLNIQEAKGNWANRKFLSHQMSVESYADYDIQGPDNPMAYQ
ncbi:3948_t:CDS:1, partial [Ambispora gerdemannii]